MSRAETFMTALAIIDVFVCVKLVRSSIVLSLKPEPTLASANVDEVVEGRTEAL